MTTSQTQFVREWHCICPERVILKVRRISQDKTGAGEGVDTQDELLDREVATWQADRVYDFKDNDQSISNGDAGPDFKRMIREIKSGMFDGAMIVTYRQDRVLREGVAYETTMRLLDEHNIALLGLRDGVKRTPTQGHLESRVRQAFAAEEIRTLKMRINDRLAKNRSRGKRHGKVPFGWNPDGTPDPIAKAMVVEATTRVLSGDSMREIARDWNASDRPRQCYTVRKRDGVKLAPEDQESRITEWSGKRILELVRRDCNAGRMLYKGQLLDVSPDWEPLVREDQWRAVRALVDGRKRVAPARRHLLGGLITCSKVIDDKPCGRKVSGVVSKTGGYTYVLYRCVGCQQYVQLAPVDEFVNELVVATLQSMDLADLVSEEHKAVMRAAIERQAALQERMRETDDGLADVGGPMEITMASYQRIMSTLRPALAHATDAVERLTDGRTEALKGLTGTRARMVWNTKNHDQRRAVISLLMDLTLMPGTAKTPIEQRIVATPRRLV